MDGGWEEGRKVVQGGLGQVDTGMPCRAHHCYLPGQHNLAPRKQVGTQHKGGCAKHSI